MNKEALEKELQTAKDLLKDCLEWFEALDPDIENTPGELGKLVKKLRKFNLSK